MDYWKDPELYAEKGQIGCSHRYGLESLMVKYSGANSRGRKSMSEDELKRGVRVECKNTGPS
jgi:hypothetical protein